ncbi:hypothetical protein [Kaarinaea lacus]
MLVDIIIGQKSFLFALEDDFGPEWVRTKQHFAEKIVQRFVRQQRLIDLC